MNLNLKMTVEQSKRRSYFLSLVFITKFIFLVGILAVASQKFWSKLLFINKENQILSDAEF